MNSPWAFCSGFWRTCSPLEKRFAPIGIRHFFEIEFVSRLWVRPRVMFASCSCRRSPASLRIKAWFSCFSASSSSFNCDMGMRRQILSLLVFYFVLSRRLLPLVSLVSFLAGQMEGCYENVRIVTEELDTCAMHRAPALPTLLPYEDAVLEIVGVSFGFDKLTPLLWDVSLRQRRGEIILLRGVSGSGKSSLLNLIAGVLQPAKGLMRVDRSSVAYVPQEIVLLDESIRTNLLFGLTDRSDTELTNALAAAQLDELIAAQPLGLDTRVGDNGILFSGGQRQRLGLARAILRGVTLLLLDEATSALDEQNEWQVLENLRASGVAVLLVTHRLHNQTFADRVFRLEGCRLIEETSQALSSYEPIVPVASIP